jgi:N-hydroxyarylamine O-acetyltransferase
MSANPESYLSRIGLDPSAARTADFETISRLQRAHVTSVPFETLSITGDPVGENVEANERGGEGVTLTLPALYEKIVERERGGFCFELNGLFGWLLGELGFDADRIAARMLSDDGDASPPANHHTHLVAFDRHYVVDVGTGAPPIRRPIPLDGRGVTDSAGVEWRVIESDRRDAELLTQYRRPDRDGWTDRFVFDRTPRKLSYFEATCDHLATSPASTFTGDPVVTIATESGHKKLSGGTLTVWEGGDETERGVSDDEYHDVLESAFGLRYR